MDANIIDLETQRIRRAAALREELSVFSRLPCPVCDRAVSPFEVRQGHASYSCDNGGRHAVASWTYDGCETVSDNVGRKRRYFTY